MIIITEPDNLKSGSQRCVRNHLAVAAGAANNDFRSSFHLSP